MTNKQLKPAPFFYYTDHSKEIDDDPLTPLTPVSRVPNFPAKMHAILAREELADVIGWLPHGRSWKIFKPREFEIRVLPTYFNHSKLSSFVRQANGWGFRRITQGADKNAYYHELFLRGIPHLCKKIRRPGVSQKSPVGPQHEPNFYEISKLLPLPETPSADGENILLECTVAGGPKARFPVQGLLPKTSEINLSNPVSGNSQENTIESTSVVDTSHRYPQGIAETNTALEDSIIARNDSVQMNSNTLQGVSDEKPTGRPENQIGTLTLQPNLDEKIVVNKPNKESNISIKVEDASKPMCPLEHLATVAEQPEKFSIVSKPCKQLENEAQVPTSAASMNHADFAVPTFGQVVVNPMQLIAYAAQQNRALLPLMGLSLNNNLCLQSLPEDVMNLNSNIQAAQILALNALGNFHPPYGYYTQK